jgi:hypothetical protein
MKSANVGNFEITTLQAREQPHNRKHLLHVNLKSWYTQKTTFKNLFACSFHQIKGSITSSLETRTPKNTDTS